MTNKPPISHLVFGMKSGCLPRVALFIIVIFFSFSIRCPGQTIKPVQYETPMPSIQDTLFYNLFRAAFSACRFDEAMEYSEKYYRAALQKNNQDEIFISLKSMFAINRQTGNYEKSFFYAQQLYDIAVKAGNKFWIANALWGLAELYTLIEDYPNALHYYARVREMSDEEVKQDRIHTDTEIWFEMEFTEAFSLVNQFDSAWHYYRVFKPAHEEYNSVYQVSTGECYFLQGNFQQALENFRQGLTGHLERNYVYEVMRTLLDLAKVYLALNNPVVALKYVRNGLQIALQTHVNRYIRDGYKILSDLYDRLQEQDSSNYYFRKYTLFKDAVLNDQAKGKFAAYDFEQRIALMNKEKQIQDTRLQNETLLKNFLIGSTGILVLFAIVFSRNIMLKRRHEARRRELAENELRIQKLEAEKSKAELMQQRSELEMKALRAQMNPHFIFNCLNAINRFIIGNNAEKAADYLTKFAKLIRMVLEKSAKPFIPLEEDLYCLQLYMDLEAIRFENPFVYEIHCYGTDQTQVMIPSLLLQPFVENAIWHGLNPVKDRTGKITITLELVNDLLLCTICDNGIGRELSAILKGDRESLRKSLGIALTKRRLQLASPLQQDAMNVTFQDLKDETGKNTGTCVQIKIPVKTI